MAKMKKKVDTVVEVPEVIMEKLPEEVAEETSQLVAGEVRQVIEEFDAKKEEPKLQEAMDKAVEDHFVSGSPLHEGVAPRGIVDYVEHASKSEPPISAYPFKTIERWASEDGREIRKLEACAYGGNGIVLKTSTRFLNCEGIVTSCSEALCTIPGVSMSTFTGSRRGKKEL